MRLAGPLIDALIRLSLLVRGRVPGGTAAAAEQAYHACAGSGTCPYYGHVTRDRGFIALQYWFLYANNGPEPHRPRTCPACFCRLHRGIAVEPPAASRPRQNSRPVSEVAAACQAS